MIRILLLGTSCFIGILFTLVNCVQSRSYYYSKLRKVNIANYNKYFQEYCEMDSMNSFQKNFTLCSFVGDYRGALNFATKEAVLRKQHYAPPNISPKELQIIKRELEQRMGDSAYTSVQNPTTRMLFNMIEGAKDIVDVFSEKTAVSAKKYIVDESGKYHFLLLNEAHYSSQNRAFTGELLKPLWEKGYRYLALETLGYTDTDLIKRGYPVLNTGYYTKDSVFGNLIREALLIGYKLIPYEAKDPSLNSTDRDSEQAYNIYNSTIKIDSIGKVIIHAGYSHISEFPGNEYKPMAFQLGKLVNQPIFTIEQCEMTELLEETVMHPYWKYALDTFKFNEPVVILNNLKIPLVDPLNTHGIDVQVYHPRTTYINGRPSWLLKGDNQVYNLSKEIFEFKGNLLQAVIPTEDQSNVPIDQLVIGKADALVLKPGNYILRIIDCNGSLIAESTLNAN